MPSDGLHTGRHGRDGTLVQVSECDGRYRVYQHDGHGMFYLAAFTRQSNYVARMLYGVVLSVGLFVVFYTHEHEAQAKADRLNLKV